MSNTKQLPLNPWVTMWRQPTKTVRLIVDINPHYQLLAVAILGGIASILSRSMNRPIGDAIPLLEILIAVILLGTVVGIAKMYIYGWLLQKTGKFLGGKATQTELRAAVAWSAVPVIWGLLPWIVAIMLYGKEWFTTLQPTMAANPLPALFFLLLNLVLSLWSIILLLKAIAEVQHISIWKAALNGILAGLVILVAAYCFGFLLDVMIGR